MATYQFIDAPYAQYAPPHQYVMPQAPPPPVRKPRGLRQSLLFLASLSKCKALIALSRYLGEELRRALDSKGFPNIPVKVLVHPTEFTEGFTMDKWMQNPDKKLVQIGSWYRSAFAMYRMPDITGPYPVCKAILKIKDSTQYYPPVDLRPTLEAMLADSQQKMGCTGATGNLWLRELLQYISDREASVRMLERLPNDEYDRLLTENIAMLWLTDCSACNTVLEYMARNTPLLLNKHPAVIEILGDTYPGLCGSVEEMALIAGNPGQIQKTHEYLLHLDKKCLMLENFLLNFQLILDEVLE